MKSKVTEPAKKTKYEFVNSQYGETDTEEKVKMTRKKVVGKNKCYSVVKDVLWIWKFRFLELKAGYVSVTD